MSTSEEKTGAPPLYPAYTATPNTYQQYSMGPVPASSAPSSNDTMQEVHHHDRNEGSKEEEKLGDIDPANFIPGKGPGGVPQQYFNLEFEDCFEEHNKTKTFAGLYRVLGVIYKFTKLVFYHIFVIVMGIPLMFFWAITNGILTFVLVWIWGPVLRMNIAVVYSTAPAFYVPVQAILTPVVDVFARIFRQCVIQAKLSGGVATSREHIV